MTRLDKAAFLAAALMAPVGEASAQDGEDGVAQNDEVYAVLSKYGAKNILHTVRRSDSKDSGDSVEEKKPEFQLPKKGNLREAAACDDCEYVYELPNHNDLDLCDPGFVQAANKFGLYMSEEIGEDGEPVCSIYHTAVDLLPGHLRDGRRVAEMQPDQYVTVPGRNAWSEEPVCMTVTGFKNTLYDGENPQLVLDVDVRVDVIDCDKAKNEIATENQRVSLDEMSQSDFFMYPLLQKMNGMVFNDMKDNPYAGKDGYRSIPNEKAQYQVYKVLEPLAFWRDTEARAMAFDRENGLTLDVLDGTLIDIDERGSYAVTVEQFKPAVSVDMSIGWFNPELLKSAKIYVSRGALPQEENAEKYKNDPDYLVLDDRNLFMCCKYQEYRPRSGETDDGYRADTLIVRGCADRNIHYITAASVKFVNGEPSIFVTITETAPKVADVGAVQKPKKIREPRERVAREGALEGVADGAAGGAWEVSLGGGAMIDDLARRKTTDPMTGKEEVLNYSRGMAPVVRLAAGREFGERLAAGAELDIRAGIEEWSGGADYLAAWGRVRPVSLGRFSPQLTANAGMNFDDAMGLNVPRAGVDLGVSVEVTDRVDVSAGAGVNRIFIANGIGGYSGAGFGAEVSYNGAKAK